MSHIAFHRQYINNTSYNNRPTIVWSEMCLTNLGRLPTLHLSIAGRCVADIRTVFTNVRTMLNTSADYRSNICICLAMHCWVVSLSLNECNTKVNCLWLNPARGHFLQDTPSARCLLLWQMCWRQLSRWELMVGHRSHHWLLPVYGDRPSNNRNHQLIWEVFEIKKKKWYPDRRKH